MEKGPARGYRDPSPEVINFASSCLDRAFVWPFCGEPEFVPKLRTQIIVLGAGDEHKQVPWTVGSHDDGLLDIGGAGGAADEIDGARHNAASIYRA